MKIRKIEKDENGDLKVRWFVYKKTVDGQVVNSSPFLEIKNEEDYVNAYIYQIYNLFNIIRGELKDKTFGILGVFGKQSREEIDIEIQNALVKKLNLTIEAFESKVEDRTYSCKFTVTTPKGYEITLEEIL